MDSVHKYSFSICRPLCRNIDTILYITLQLVLEMDVGRKLNAIGKFWCTVGFNLGFIFSIQHFICTKIINAYN
jgi:hypothetical protein